MISGSRDPSRERPDGGDQAPGRCARDGLLEVLGERPVSIVPHEVALDYRSPWPRREAFAASARSTIRRAQVPGSANRDRGRISSLRS
jgi:hypothetical protein